MSVNDLATEPSFALGAYRVSEDPSPSYLADGVGSSFRIDPWVSSVSK